MRILSDHYNPPTLTERPTIRLVVTDLDNTLYDWVTFYARSFNAMVDVAHKLLKVSRERLLDELREVHQRFHNSEYPYALLLTRAAQDCFPDADRNELHQRPDPAFHRFNSIRKRTLQLYPGVRETLTEIRSRGVSIVGHTEATVPNALFRLEKLELLPIFERLYALRHEGVVHRQRRTSLRDPALPVRYLDPCERKPNPDVLLEICRDLRVAPQETLYVGDSLSRDIGMATQAGVKSAWAKFGTRYSREDWDALVRITHWTADDVERAQSIQSRFGGARPDVVLEGSYSELLAHFEFRGREQTRAARES